MTIIKTKSQLIEAIHQNRGKLLRIVSRLNADQMEQPGVCGEWSAKDVLAHLFDWQERNIEWIHAAQRGVTPQVPGAGFTWKPADVDRLNRIIFESHRHQTVDEVMRQFHETYQRFMDQLEQFSEAELLMPGFMPFTGQKGTLLGWYKHYVYHDGWGRALIYNKLVRKPRRAGIIDLPGDVA